SSERIAVVTAAGPDAGRTRLAEDGALVRVAVRADRPRFESELLGTLVAGAPFSIPRAVAPATLTYDGTSCRYSGPRTAEAGQVAFDTINRSAVSFGQLVLDRSSGP